MEHDLSYFEYPAENVDRVRKLFLEHKLLLAQYVDRLLWWNEKINLVSRGVPRETILNHVEHSLAISQSSLFLNSDSIIDSGTGGGLPGIPLAIAFPKKRIILNDIVSKKIMACKHIVSGLKLENIDSNMGSLEDIELKANSLIISKHAFKVGDMINMLAEKPWPGIILLKGRDEVEGELEGVKERLDISIYDLHNSFGNPFYKGKAMVEIKRKGRYE